MLDQSFVYGGINTCGSQNIKEIFIGSSNIGSTTQEKKKENPGLGRRPGSGTTDTVQYRDKAPARESENRGRSKHSDCMHSREGEYKSYKIFFQTNFFMAL